MKKIRVGLGYDVHRLEKGEDFWLGGIKIDSEFGAVGHSDADVLIHAICDAILGAANLRDIGYHFSDKDPKYKGVDSKKLLTQTLQFIREKGYSINNIDATVCLEKPKIGKYIPDMISCLSQILEIDKDDISIKATTSEQMGFVGKGEGVACHAVCCIYK